MQISFSLMLLLLLCSLCQAFPGVTKETEPSTNQEENPPTTSLMKKCCNKMRSALIVKGGHHSAGDIKPPNPKDKSKPSKCCCSTQRESSPNSVAILESDEEKSKNVQADSQDPQADLDKSQGVSSDKDAQNDVPRCRCSKKRFRRSVGCLCMTCNWLISAAQMASLLFICC